MISSILWTLATFIDNCDMHRPAYHKVNSDIQPGFGCTKVAFVFWDEK